MADHSDYFKNKFEDLPQSSPAGGSNVVAVS